MTPPPLATAGNEPTDLFAVLRERDVLVHHPYDSFATSVEAFVAQAADDPDVLGHQADPLPHLGRQPDRRRRSSGRPSAGKQVAALVELKARFDEQANIGWARALEEAGVHVVYGLVGLKTHSKTALVLRREDDGIRRYCHVGTGNYNSKTARIYEDLGLLTADADIGADVGDLFNYLTGFSRHAGYRQLLVSPVTLRHRMLELIERAGGRPARPGRIVIKLNGLTDPEMIDALYARLAAGVPIDLAVRGLCCLRPGRPRAVRDTSGCARSSASSSSTRGSTASAAATVGPARPTGGRVPVRLLIGSADLMERNLDRRIEALVPGARPRAAGPPARDPRPGLRRRHQLLGARRSDRRWRRVPTEAGVSVQERLKELAIERARRRREPEPRVRDGRLSPGPGRRRQLTTGRLAVRSRHAPGPARGGPRARSAATGRQTPPAGMGSQKLTSRQAEHAHDGDRPRHAEADQRRDEEPSTTPRPPGVIGMTARMLARP